jgi:hypothetical protein
MSQVVRWCARITDSRLFEVLIIVVIGANAILPRPADHRVGAAAQPAGRGRLPRPRAGHSLRVRHGRLAADYDADGDGRPDELDRLAISQRLDDLRTVITELERELRVRNRAPPR